MGHPGTEEEAVRSLRCFPVPVRCSAPTQHQAPFRSCTMGRVGRRAETAPLLVRRGALLPPSSPLRSAHPGHNGRSATAGLPQSLSLPYSSPPTPLCCKDKCQGSGPRFHFTLAFCLGGKGGEDWTLSRASSFALSLSLNSTARRAGLTGSNLNYLAD